MSFLAVFVGILTIGGAHFSFKIPSEVEMVDSFGEAQRFYAEGAYDQAIEGYLQVSQIRSRILDAQSIQVTVGEETYPVQEAAIYQIGNAQGKLYVDYARFSDEARSSGRRAEYRVLADTAFAASARAFQGIIDDATSEVLRGRAHGRLVELYFSAEAYPRVIEASKRLIAVDPYGVDAIVAYYNTGWAHYEMREYEQAIEAFSTLVEQYPTGYQSDRSLFQIGEAYLEMGEYLEAIDHYAQLVKRQHIADLTEEELKRMKREKLAGLVDETALEMAAKAEIRIGTCYARLGRFEDGVATYTRVIELFSTEARLVEEAYLQMAELYQRQGDDDAAERTYRRAIDQSSDRILKARIQYKLAERLVEQAQFAKAVQEYRIYLRGYGDVAQMAGFPEGRVRSRIGSAYHKLAERTIEESGPGSAGDDLLVRAIAQYDTLTSDENSPYALDARYHRALALQALATDESTNRAREEFEAIIGSSAEAQYVQGSLIKLSELHHSRGRYELAARRAQQILDSFPQSHFRGDAYWSLAQSLRAQEQHEKAVQAFLSVSQDSPLFARARLNAGHVLVTRLQHQRAIQVLESGLERGTSEQLGSFHYLLGQAHSGLKQYGEAVDHFTRGLAHAADASLEEELRFSRGNTSLLLEDYDQGETDFRWVVANHSDSQKVKYARDALYISFMTQNRGADAIRLLDEMLENTQSSEEQAELLSRIADLYYDRDDYEQTADLAARLLALDFADGTTAERPYTLRDKSYFLWGDVLLRLKRPQDAADKFQEALEVNPDSYFATTMRLNLATHYFAEGELERAQVIFLALREVDLDAQQDLLVDFYLANTHYSLREFSESRSVFRQLLVRHPRSEELQDILFGLGESHYQLGEFQEAIQNYRLLLTQFPTGIAADDAQYNMAWSLIELQQEEQAMTAFGRLLKRYPDSEFAASAQFTFGDHAYNRGDYEAAAEAYRTVQEKYSDAPVAKQVPRLLSELGEAIAYQEYEIGLALMDSADATQNAEYFREAAKVFDKVQERFPGTESEIGALSNMGVCLEGLGEWREAVEVYEQVIGLYEEQRATKEAFQFAKSHRDWIVSTRL
ncbi:MAG: hypothetical protein CME15_14270 [Gemmatimonadetes bacterium]|nr:hypothetical protein [Gemmatimonadota bacterium]